MTTMTSRRENRFAALLDAPLDEYTDAQEKRGPLDNEKAVRLHTELMGHFANELSRQSDNRMERGKAEDYKDGLQFTDAERAEIESRGQTPTVLNVVGPAVNWMLGNERRNRSQAKVLPRRKEGRKDADMKTAYLKYLDDSSYAEMAKSQAFHDAVVTGVGWIETGYNHNADGEPIYQRWVSWREILHDSFARRLDGEDGRYLFRAKWTDVSLAMARFPDRKHVIKQAAYRDNNVLHGAYDGYGDEQMDEWEDDIIGSDQTTYAITEAMRPRVRLIEAWTRRPKMTDVMKGGLFNGEIFDPNSLGHVQEFIMGNAQVVQKMRNRVEVHIMTSAGFISSEPSPYRHNRFPYTPIWGNRRGRDGMPYGVVHSMMHLQDNINKRYIKAEYILNTNKVLAEEGFTDDVDDFMDEVARPDGVMIYKQGKKPDINTDKELTAAHTEMMSMAIDMVQQLSGITDESMGRTTNATSGKAIQARQQQGAMVTANYYDNLRHGLQVHGEKLVCVMEQFADKEKQFRVISPRGRPDFRTINDPNDPITNITRMKADFVIGEEDWKATNRQASADAFAQVMQQVAPADPSILLSVIDLFVSMLDLPYGEEIVARLRNHYNIEDPDEDPDDDSPEALERRAQREAKAAEADEAAAIARKRELAEANEAEASAQKAMGEARVANNEAVTSKIEARAAHLKLLKDAISSATELKNAQPLAALIDGLIAEADAEVEELEDNRGDGDDLTGSAPQAGATPPPGNPQAGAPMAPPLPPTTQQ